MRKKILIGVLSFLTISAAVTVGVVFGTKAYNQNKTPKLDSKLDEIAKKIDIDYENKENTEVATATVSKIKFENLDKKLYDVLVETSKTSEALLDSIEVVFKILDKKNNAISNTRKFTISGFKKHIKATSQEDLNKIIEQINSIIYKDDKTKITTREVEAEKIVFENLDQKYETVIKHVWFKLVEESTLKVTFTIREKNQIAESLSKVLEIKGFKESTKPKTLDELNAAIDELKTGKYNMSTEHVSVLTADAKNIVFDNLDNGLEIEVISFKQKESKETTGVLVFKIKEKNGPISSKEKTIEIPGFRESFLGLTELNNEAELIIDVIYDDDNLEKRKSILVNDIDKSKLKLSPLLKGFEGIILKVVPEETDSSVAMVTYSIKEIGSKIQSDPRIKRISGFKMG